MRAIFCLFTLALGGIVSPVAAVEPLIVEETFLTVGIDGKDYRLETLIAREAGDGKRPIAIVTHGQSGEEAARDKTEARNMLNLAREFARRGWLAAAVVRRGFGRSQGGGYALQGCRDGNYPALLKGQTDDLEAALKAIGRRADADPTTAIALGVSMGGAAVLDLAARRPEGLKAVINVSGGIRTLPKPDGGRPVTCTPDDLVRTVGGFGERGGLPSLWLYSENDSYFPADHVRALHETYVAKGGRAQFHMFEPIGKDGHFMVANFDGMLRILPALDRFLRDNRLKTYDPAPIEAAFGTLRLTQDARIVARRYDGRQTEKVMAVSRSGKSAYVRFGGKDITEIEATALQECETKVKEPCRVILRNFEVVAAAEEAASQRAGPVPPAPPTPPTAPLAPTPPTLAVPPSPTTTKGAQ